MYLFHLFRWYFGAITQKNAEDILTQSFNPLGSFLVHDSETRSGNYFLSIKDTNQVRHYQIHSLDVGGFFITLRLTFNSIPHLISHYSQQADGLCMTLKCSGIQQSDPFGIDHSTLHPTKVIEINQLYEVSEGIWKNEIPVAIHTPKKGSASENIFFEEIELMKQLKHSNIIKLYGVCTKEKPLCFITELMNIGNLQDYLRKKGKFLIQSLLIDMGAQIASGMAYLESKNCVHRNLLAKNILLTKESTTQRLICKVTNFSCARIIIISKNNFVKSVASETFPTKWTAPETLRSGCFTIKSDIWSFGIVLYELLSLGSVPYPGILTGEVLKKLESGYRMPCPSNCPEKLYKVMLECWRKDAQTRPTFETLQWKLEDYYYSDYVEN